MTFQKQTYVLLALGASALSLSACTTHPNAMPSGYTYHHEVYKSPTPSDSKKVSDAQREYMDAAQAEQFRDATYDLLERLTMRAGMPPKPVYVASPDPMTPFFANFDNDLREGMRHMGYAISDIPEGAYVFVYEAIQLSGPNKEALPEGSNNVYLTLRVFDAYSKTARQLAEESGEYYIQGSHLTSIAPVQFIGMPSRNSFSSRAVNYNKPQYVAPKSPINTPMRATSSMVEPSSPVPPPIDDFAPIGNNIPHLPVEAPMDMDAPMVEVPMQEPAQATISAPAVRTPTAPPVVAPTMTAPDISEVPTASQIQASPQAAEMPKRKRLSVPAMSGKKPSHKDIVIINRGDKNPLKEAVSDSAPMMPKIEDSMDMPEAQLEPENALQNAIPTSDAAIRGRVSNPSDY